MMKTKFLRGASRYMISRCSRPASFRPIVSITLPTDKRASPFLDQKRYYRLGPSDHRPDFEYEIPHNVRTKTVNASDAVALVRDGDTICASGFVSQGAAEAVLKALGERYEETGSPNKLTLLFGGGPGDWDTKGLNHLAKMKPDAPPMLSRTIGGHYGQTPQIAQMALDNIVEAWTIPMGSVSRMLRAQSTHTPGHITSVGLGTYVDPDIAGGAANEAAANSPFHSELISKIELVGQTQLMYKALPIDVAIIRGTTADAQGNITVEHESLLCDQRVTAAAAKNSGGIVIAQVKRLATTGSLSSRSVVVPGALVDCVVVVDEQDHDTLHPMSFVERHNPAFTGELKSPQDQIQKMPLDIRKIIARRSFFDLKPDSIVNLGIGLPEGVAAVAAEEDLLKYVTLTTEPGVFGGLPAHGHSFGPAINAEALVEMNQMFDFYDGGGLNMSFLGAAQIAGNGDVNVSRMSKNRLTGPGGFIDISQSTPKVTFMTPMTTKNLKISMPGDGTLKIDNEGEIKKFVPEVFEKTFSGEEAVRRGQEVYYVTERCVFRRTARYDVLELVEIAPGIDLEKDVLQQLSFEPAISPDLKTMDKRIFIDEKMDASKDIFGSFDECTEYHESDHTMYLNLFGITLNTDDDLKWFFGSLRRILDPHVKEKGPINMVINYDGFDLRKGLDEPYVEMAKQIQADMFGKVKRFTGSAFRRAQLKEGLSMGSSDASEMFDEADTDGNGLVSVEELRIYMAGKFHINLTPSQLLMFQTDASDPSSQIDRNTFAVGLEAVFKDLSS